MQRLESASLLPDLKFGCPSICTYCGEPATTTDHIFCKASQTIRTKANQKGFGPVTYACRECNCRILHSRMFSTFEVRSEYVHNWLENRVKAVFWSMRDIEALSWELRELVRGDRNRRLLMRFRADWYESRTYLLNIENLLFTDIFSPGHPKYNRVLHDYFSTTIFRLRELYRSRH